MDNHESAFPQRSAGGLAAADIFYRNYNNFNFYVEDQDKENLYYEILRKIFPSLRFDKIFPLGGKSNIIVHARDSANASLPNRVYIVDKDFDDLLHKKETISNVFYLNKFCIENFLIQESALIEVIVESCPTEKRDDIRACLENHG
ncbi:DUF4435 domain-containing protein [Acetobacter sacchari]|uniref:DUF4435 domain-containing protein n=1 Tax=Acetobacter sacchari TaxID=2661687 RepID=A0ABS3M039_9PROT|nr:DUF4435 domain-containing protein [Acetobacter sacchari]